MSSETYLLHLYEHPELITADLHLLKRHVASGSRFLDIGAGRGSFVSEASRQGFDATAVDMQPDAPQVWRQAAISGVLGDGAHAPFVDGSFDLVRLKEVIEHVEDPLSLVREARRLLKPGGFILAHVPSTYSQFYPVGNFWDDYTHVRPFSRTGLQRLFNDARFEVLQIDGYVAGRNAVERALGKALARVIPHIYRVIARK